MEYKCIQQPNNNEVYLNTRLIELFKKYLVYPNLYDSFHFSEI